MKTRAGVVVGISSLILLGTSLHAQEQEKAKPPATFAEADYPAIAWGHYRTIHSRTLGEDRRLLVRLPDDYGRSDKKYPVLFKLDGEKGSFLHALSAGYYLFDMTEGAPDLIIVGVENTDRGRDMQPDQGADRFVTFLESELIPFVDAAYRTSGVRILCGQSLTSVFGLYSFLKQPALFDGYILSSFSLYKESLTEIFETELKRNPALRRESPAGKVCLFVASGTRDPYDPDGSRTRRGAAFLESLRKVVPASVGFEIKAYDGEGHVPYASFHDGLRWIYSCKGAPTQ